MDKLSELLNLPFETLLTLGVGYIGYLLSFNGKNLHHKTIDVIFITLVFGFLGKIFYLYLQNKSDHLIINSVSTISLVILCAALWRKWFERAIYFILRKLRISISNGSSSAWDHMRHRADLGPTRIVVRKKDGSSLMCDNVWDFRKEPTGPCIYGNDGSISLFVTAYRKSVSDKWNDIDPRNKSYGSAMTFVSASEISEIEIRNK